jgi:hypothetical protein
MELFQRMTLRVISAAIIGGVGAVAAADLPKEGKYDVMSCWSGPGNFIDFSTTPRAVSYELTGTNRSDPPGGFLDMVTFRCVGFTSTSDGKLWSGMNMCENIDKDGDKLLARNIIEGPKNTLEGLAGTGKYEGIVWTGVGESLGAFRSLKPGTLQGCGHNTGTYKMK